MKILIFDPSGNFSEGKGTSGWAQYYNKKLVSVGQLRAEEYANQMVYWDAHLTLIEALEPDVIVVEGYRLFASAKEAQINSELETPQLIGVLKLYCHKQNIPIRIQQPQIKHRFTNEVLLHRKIVSQDSQKRYYAVGVPITRHILDAIRHGEYYINFRLKKEKFDGTSN